MTRHEFEGIHILRVVACFMIVLIHVAARYFNQFSPKWDAAVFYNCFSRASIPLFIMITGYLLMERQENAITFYKKRFGKILAPLLFYSVGYYLVSKKPWKDFFEALFAGPIEFHLWYMYMLCGLYFALPFLQKIWLSCSIQEKKLLLSTWFILYCIFPALSTFSILTYHPVSIFSLSIPELWGYVFLGAYLKEIPTLNRVLCFFIYTISSALIVYTSHIFSIAAGTPTAPFMGNMSFLTAIAAVGAFMGIRDCKICWAKTWVLQLSRCAFGIYLIHILLIGQIGKRLPEAFFSLSPWIMIPLFSILAFLCSFAIICPLKQLKFSRQFVG